MHTLAASARPKFFRRCWSGTAPLWQAWWLVGVAGQVAALLLCVALVLPFWRGERDNGWANALTAVVLLGWLALASVAIWRCAPNAGRPFWGALARTLLVLSWGYAGLVVGRAFLAT